MGDGMRVWMIAVGLVALALLLLLPGAGAHDPASLNPAQDGYLRAPRLGITFINSAEAPLSDQRYQQALYLGAGWTRWPLYWNLIERVPDVYDWSAYDQLVIADMAYGLRINAILMGRPPHRIDGGSITGLDAPIFADGTDDPAPNKAINPQNPWAHFVHAAVMRYKPGGTLATAQGWSAGRGITVWEAWNEPDLPQFWAGTRANYARLLQVTYLAAHHADPNAMVMFGGLAYGNPEADDWLADVLAIFDADPQRERYGWYMDAVAYHSYTYARRSGDHARRIRGHLARRGLDHPIWLNETGVAVWDDYPGPVWTAAQPAARVLRTTSAGAAAYFVQSAAYAWAEGAEIVMFHQLYDDCGNQGSGANFPPHNGELCAGGGICWGDAHGLYRNLPSSICFNQHPQPGSPRPAAGAYHLLARTVGAAPFERAIINTLDARAVVISFDVPLNGERIHVLWNNTLEPAALDLPASGETAWLYQMDGGEIPLFPEAGRYSIRLAAADDDAFPFLRRGDEVAIGGPPVVIVERVAGGAINPALPQLAPPDAPARPLALTPGPIDAPARPTVDPANDRTPPTTAMGDLPPVSPPTFTVTWTGHDDVGIGGYLVWVRVDGGAWEPWLETTETRAEFTGAPGRSYDFAVWAVDLAGNWSTNVELTPQATTRIE